MIDTVESVLALNQQDLLERWEVLFGRKPHTHASFMRLALAWKLQAIGKGGASPELPSVRNESRRASTILGPRMRLVREWRGITYHVLVTEHGVDHASKTYRSLSAIARQIMGRHVDGGLRAHGLDPNLLTLIHRGTKWFRRLAKEGCGPSMIAEEEKVSPALVQRMIYTAFLAPDIVKLIEAGEQPATLTSRTLMDALPLPPNWTEQRILFGIRASP